MSCVLTDLELDNILVCEGTSQQQQSKALHLGHGCKGLQLPQHLLPKSLHICASHSR